MAPRNSATARARALGFIGTSHGAAAAIAVCQIQSAAFHSGLWPSAQKAGIKTTNGKARPSRALPDHFFLCRLHLKLL